MIKKTFSFICLFLFIILVSCSDSTSNKPTPPNVTITNTTMSWDTSWETIIWARVTGTATNSGQTAAITVQVQLELLNSSQVSISKSSWVTIFETLNGGSSLGWTVSWYFNDPCPICQQAAFYRIHVQWSNNSIKYESDFIIPF